MNVIQFLRAFVFVVLLGTIIVSVSSFDKSESASKDGTNNPPPVEVNLSEQNLLRAMELTDKAVASHFTGEGMAMARYYNPYTETRSEEKGSVWMYTSALEAVNAILHGLEAQKNKIMVHSTQRLSTGKCTKKHPPQDEMMESAKISAQMSLLPNKARETGKTDFPYSFPDDLIAIR